MTPQQAHTALRVAAEVADLGTWRKHRRHPLCTAEDLAGAALLRICEASEAAAGAERFEAWARTLAWRAIRDYVRDTTRMGRAVPEPEVRPSEDDRALLFRMAEAPDRADFRAEAAEVRAAVAQLPRPLRVPLQRHYFDGLTQREIADAEGVHRTRIVHRIRNAVALLRGVYGVNLN